MVAWVFCLCFVLQAACLEEVIIRLEHDGDFHALYDRIPSLSVDRPNTDGTLNAYVLDRDLPLFGRFNYTFEILPNDAPQKAREVRESCQRRRQLRQSDQRPPSPVDWATYHDYEDLSSLMKSFADNFPEITQLFSIGRSGAGRELWGLKISADPEGEHPEKPKIHYVGNMHGDEVVGRELLLRFIDFLLVTYTRFNGESEIDRPDSPEAESREDGALEAMRVVRLVQETQIYIVPTMNPDGFELGTRGNSMRVDLNRNFPDQYRGDSTRRQPETQAIMDWVSSHHFVISINFHGGACVCSFPFDGTASGRTEFSPSPENNLVQFMCNRYARSNLPMFRSREFSGGITNGAAWYPLYGGMADWKYLEGGSNDVELTIELSDVKWPAARELPHFWDDNRESMLSFFENIFTGVWGRITLAGRGCKGEVIVQGISNNVPTNSDGYFFRVLKPGDYTISYACGGRITDTERVSVPEGDPVNVEINF